MEQSIQIVRQLIDEIMLEKLSIIFIIFNFIYKSQFTNDLIYLALIINKFLLIILTA
jgi:hypothetical protein